MKTDKKINWKEINEFFKVGHAAYSETKLPNGIEDNTGDYIIMDFPGYNDTDSLIVDICTCAWIK